MNKNRLIHINGDLLKSDCTTIIHQANCFSNMGAGIAKSISKIHPKAGLADHNSGLSPKEKLGKYTSATFNGLTVVNAYGQYNYGRGRRTDYNALEKSLRMFFSDVAKGKNEANITKVGVPYKISCGLAGGDWTTVQNILEKIGDEFNVSFHIYKLKSLGR